MPTATLIYGEETKQVKAEKGALLGDVIASTDLPLEQPCAGRGTCGLCKVIDEGGLNTPDAVELEHLSEGELAIGNRLACRARIESDTTAVLTPVIVYSNKIFRSSSRYKREKDVPLGLAIDLGTTTVAAYVTMLDNGEVCAAAASLNQQSVFGADIISRLASASKDTLHAERLHKLSVASINQAIDALKLSKSIRERITRATVVCNPAMHHLLTKLPVNSLCVIPFQPHDSSAIEDASPFLDAIFPQNTKITLAPLVGGFIGSDALACLAYFGFHESKEPIVAIDLGTNGEVMVSDGKQILTASTAAGPAFEGVNISCGTRAVDGAITGVGITENEIVLETIGGEPPVGLTGSGLIAAIQQFRRIELIDKTGRINHNSPYFEKWGEIKDRIKAIRLEPAGKLVITQPDIRELQKGKGAIRAAIEILMENLALAPEDIKKFYLTGSFGGQIDVDAIIEIGMIPPVRREVVEAVPSGAGFGAAMFLSDDGFALAKEIATLAQQIELDQDTGFIKQFLKAMAL